MRPTYNSIEIKSKEIMKYNKKNLILKNEIEEKKYTKHYSSE
jgi:hypothetical protein